MRITGLARLWAAALLLGLAACAGAGGTGVTAWQEFRMPGADFAVSVPTTPEINDDVTGKDGNIRRHYLIDAGAVSYMIAYKTSAGDARRPTPLDGWLNNVRNALVAKMKGNMREEHRFSVGDSRCMAFVLEVPPSGAEAAYTINGRIYVKHAGSGRHTKDVLYQTLVVGNPARDEAASVTRFLDSFHFVTG